MNKKIRENSETRYYPLVRQGGKTKYLTFGYNSYELTEDINLAMNYDSFESAFSSVSFHHPMLYVGNLKIEKITKHVRWEQEEKI